eukprot:Pgem_evm1s12464
MLYINLGPVVFTIWIGFYTFKTRSASQEYNDYWINKQNSQYSGGFLSTKNNTNKNKSRDYETNNEQRSTNNVLISKEMNNDYGKSIVYDGPEFVEEKECVEIAV